MTNVKGTTKKGSGLICSYNMATARNLFDCYASVSRAKVAAFNSCMDFMKRMHGYDSRICSFNSFSFSFAFRFKDETTGGEKLMYITRDNDYCVTM